MPEVFQDVRVTVIRPDRVDPDGLCGEFNPQDDFKSAALQPGNRMVLILFSKLRLAFSICVYVLRCFVCLLLYFFMTVHGSVVRM